MTVKYLFVLSNSKEACCVLSVCAQENCATFLDQLDTDHQIQFTWLIYIGCKTLALVSSINKMHNSKVPLDHRVQVCSLRGSKEHRYILLILQWSAPFKNFIKSNKTSQSAPLRMENCLNLTFKCSQIQQTSLKDDLLFYSDFYNWFSLRYTACL